MNETLAKNVAYYRGLLGYSQQQLATQANLSLETITAIEEGTSGEVGLDTLRLLAAALDVSIHTLLWS